MRVTIRRTEGHRGWLPSGYVFMVAFRLEATRAETALIERIGLSDFTLYQLSDGEYPYLLKQALIGTFKHERFPTLHAADTFVADLTEQLRTVKAQMDLYMERGSPPDSWQIVEI